MLFSKVDVKNFAILGICFVNVADGNILPQARRRTSASDVADSSLIHWIHDGQMSSGGSTRLGNESDSSLGPGFVLDLIHDDLGSWESKCFSSSLS